MTSLTHRGQGPAFPYAGQPMHILAGQDGLPPGFAAMELTVPPHFAGPIPHAHDEFDEAIYVLSGRLLVHGGDDGESGRGSSRGEPAEAVPGSLFVAPRGHRHGFSNPSAESALVLGIWAPRNPPWPSCARSARPSPRTSRPTRFGCVRSTPGTPAAFCPDRWPAGRQGGMRAGPAGRPGRDDIIADRCTPDQGSSDPRSLLPPGGSPQPSRPPRGTRPRRPGGSLTARNPAARKTAKWLMLLAGRGRVRSQDLGRVGWV